MGKRSMVAVLALASSAAIAQVRPDAGRVLEQTREPLRLPPPREADVLPRPPEPKPALPAQPQLRVTVKAFTFTGNTIFSDAFLQSVVAEYVGRQLDFDDLTEAALKVRAFHRERGYFLTQAYLPEQTIRDGVVQIGIIEGRIGEIEIVRRPATRLREGLLAGIVGSHWRQGQIITETGLEKPLLLINDLPTAAVTSEIRPSRTLGAADLRVNVDQGVSWFNGFVDLDNHGNRFTGENRLGASLNLNNPLTLGDQASFRGFRTDEDMWFTRLSYLVPVWYYGTRVGVSYSEFAYELAKDFAALEATGEGEVGSLFAFHPVYRTRNANVILQFAYEDKRLFDQVATTSTIEERSIDSVKAGVVGDFRDGIFGGGLNSYAVTLTQGDLRLETPALAAADVGATGRRPQGRFRKMNLDLRRLQRISDAVNLLVAFSGQEASKNLASAEKISLGGPNGVRAYPVGEATGDTGMILQTELRYRVPGFKFGGVGDVTLSAHFDHGWVKINQIVLPSDGENERSFSGYGVGVSIGNEGDFIVRVTASERNGELPTSDPTVRHPRLWGQLVKWF
ncbi:MAG: ShlB/FhaC/HecB family hemolysin secretion/activation protein [Betaproteobacteria bacterium]